MQQQTAKIKYICEIFRLFYANNNEFNQNKQKNDKSSQVIGASSKFASEVSQGN